jgi:hypothetical protein
MKIGFAGMLLLALAACAKDSGDAKPAAPPPAPAPAAAVDSPAAPSADTSAWIADGMGIGPVRVGMDLAAAYAAVPGGLGDTTKIEPECAEVGAADRRIGLRVMMQRGRVVRVEVGDNPRVATREGLRPGDSERRARETYPSARLQPHKYDTNGVEMIVISGAPADTLHRMVIGTDGRAVTWMRAGIYPPVEYVEGCS